MKNFDEFLSGDIAVYFKNDEEQKQFLILCSENDLKWITGLDSIDGYLPECGDLISVFKKGTLYRTSIHDNIVPAADFLK